MDDRAKLNQDKISFSLEIEKNQGFLKNINDIKIKIRERVRTLDTREHEIIKEENNNKQQFKKLALKWAGYLKAITKNNARTQELDREADSISIREKAIELRSQSQDQRDHNLYKREVALSDKYKTLEDAVDEHRKKGVKIP